MNKKISRLTLLCLYTFAFGILFSACGGSAVGEEPVVSKGQTIYVPVYSHIVVGGGKRKIPFELTINLSIRNTDPKHPIAIVRADYYDSEGKLVKTFAAEPVTIKPMASTYYYIARSDTSGGWGANFIIKWESEVEVNEPIIESVTYGSRGTHSLSFVSRGKVIKD